MTSKQIAETIAAAIQTEQCIADLQEQLAIFKSKLLNQAQIELRKEPCPPDFVGCSYTFKDDIGQIARVNFPNPKLISMFWLSKDSAWRFQKKEVVQVGDIERLAGKHFAKLFLTHYKPAKSFRELAPMLLGQPASTKLIDLCQEPSSPRVCFETKETASGIAAAK